MGLSGPEIWSPGHGVRGAGAPTTRGKEEGMRQWKWAAVVGLIAALGLLWGCARFPGLDPLPGGQVTQPQAGFEVVEGKVRVLIGFKQLPGAAEEALVRAYGAEVRFRYRLIPAIAATVPEAALAALQRDPRVTVIEPDVKIYVLSYAAELDNTWGVKRIGAGTVHTSGNLGTAIKVAVIDTGIDYTHPELSPNYKGGYDFVNNDSDPRDDHGHGTHVAGTVAARRDGTGVVGVAPEAHLYALKVLGADGSGSFSSVIAALEWCVNNGLQITNNSYGSSQDPGTLTKAAFDNAYAAGILHVAAAGNSGNPAGRGDNVGYPARYETVIAVAATNQDDARASFSSTGPAVELAAPGVSINSTKLGGGYTTMSGTSMASPHVAGAAALVWKAYPTWTNDQVRQQLQKTADDLGPTGRDTHYGYGLVDAVEATGTTPPGGTMYVHSIDMALTGNPNNTRATATVVIRDTNGNPVAGATVTGEWSGATSGTASGTTDSNGTVTFTSGSVRRPPSGTTFTFCVTNVTKSGWTYDSTRNNETCDSVTVK